MTDEQIRGNLDKLLAAGIISQAEYDAKLAIVFEMGDNSAEKRDGAYCASCGKRIPDDSAFCPFCGVKVNAATIPKNEAPRLNSEVARSLDEAMPANDHLQCTAEAGEAHGENKNVEPARPRKSKVAAGLLALFLGGLGWHKLYFGYHKEWLITMALWFLGWNVGIVGGGVLFSHFGSVVIATISGVEGIIYLTKSDEVFQHTYVENQKPWF